MVQRWQVGTPVASTVDFVEENINWILNMGWLLLYLPTTCQLNFLGEVLYLSRELNPITFPPLAGPQKRLCIHHFGFTEFWKSIRDSIGVGDRNYKN